MTPWTAAGETFNPRVVGSNPTGLTTFHSSDDSHVKSTECDLVRSVDGYALGLAAGHLFAPGTWLVPRELKDCRQVAAHCSIPCPCLAERDHGVGKLASRFWSRKERRSQKLLTVGPSPFRVRKLNKPVEARCDACGRLRRGGCRSRRATPQVTPRRACRRMLTATLTATAVQRGARLWRRWTRATRGMDRAGPQSTL